MKMTTNAQFQTPIFTARKCVKHFESDNNHYVRKAYFCLIGWFFLKLRVFYGNSEKFSRIMYRNHLWRCRKARLGACAVFPPARAFGPRTDTSSNLKIKTMEKNENIIEVLKREIEIVEKFTREQIEKNIFGRGPEKNSEDGENSKKFSGCAGGDLGALSYETLPAMLDKIAPASFLTFTVTMRAWATLREMNETFADFDDSLLYVVKNQPDSVLQCQAKLTAFLKSVQSAYN